MPISIQIPHFNYLLFCKFCKGMLASFVVKAFFKNSSGMKGIIRAGDVFKIFRAIICFYTILVIYLKSIWKFSNKSTCNKSMHKMRRCFSVAEKTNRMVSIMCNSRLFNSKNSGSRRSTNSSNSPQITGFVEGFFAWYWLPIFHATSIVNQNSFVKEKLQ